MTGRASEHRFIVSYGPRPRVWCSWCDKAEAIGTDGGNGEIDGNRLAAAEETHRCGPRTSQWASGDDR